MSDDQLEDALRAQLHEAIDPRVPGPAAEQRVLAAVNEAGHARGGWGGFHLGPRTGAAIAAAMVVLVVGGALGVSLALRNGRVSGPGPATSVPPVASPSPSPSISESPSPARTQSPTLTGTQTCTAGVLTAEQYDQDGAAGTSGGDIALRNAGTVACTLEGYVNLQGVVDGRVVQLGVTHSIGGPLLNNSNGTLPTVRLVTLLPGTSAYVAYEVSDVINGPSPCASTQTLLITPPNDGASVTLANTPISLCGGYHATLWIDIAPVSSVPYYNTSIP
ncbi:MAG: DUF4232 domain-containing protein [Candidatus Dormibacteria bacterium]|jgi:hypothetical protein